MSSSRTLYSSDGDGHWIKTVWEDQCGEAVFLRGKCQGVKGHEGDHWCYGPDGSYHSEVQGELEPHEIRGGSTPPGHESWISPVDKAADYYLTFYERTEVTDAKEIARLEAGNLGENESITQPVKWDELEEDVADELQRRLKNFSDDE